MTEPLDSKSLVNSESLNRLVAERKANLARQLVKRHKIERRFRFTGVLAIVLSLGFLVVLALAVLSKGYSAFVTHDLQLAISFDEEFLDPQGTRATDTLKKADYAGLIKKTLRATFPDVKNRRAKKRLYELVSADSAYQLRDRVLENPDLIGTTRNIWLPTSGLIDIFLKGRLSGEGPEEDRPIKDDQITWLEVLEQDSAVRMRFNSELFTNADSREPEAAGILGALTGSFLMLLVTLALSFPLGVAAAIYLQEFAPKNRWTDLIEVNINNLAAVPSIVFGLLGLAVFLNVFGLPRSAPLVGGMVLSLLTLPTIIIASRAALASIPPSIREAALGIGASRMQTVFHHVVPLALPGMLTGAIIGMAGALGETAPLLMIGMVAFIVDVPGHITDAATALPVQIYLWADSPERAFEERTAAAILVLLVFLVLMNLTAVLLRQKFSKRWQ